MSPSILFCTPCYGGQVTSAHFRSCLDLKDALMSGNMPHNWLVGWNDSLINRIRNEMAAEFLKSEHSHLFWLDADIEFKPEDVASIWNLQADIGVAAYTMKRSDKPLSAWKNGKLVTIDDCPKEPFEVDLAGTGFMAIKREVFEKLSYTAPSYEGHNGRVSAFFMVPVHDDVLESEDYHFCRLAREAGFKIIMDPSVRLGHIGQFRYGD